MSNIKTQTGKVIGRSLNAYHSRVKPKIDELKFKESYQGKIIDCMVGEVDDNYIVTPETDVPIVKLEHSKEGLVKIPTIKGKTILVDADGNETDTPAEGCKLVSVGEAEDNKMIILSKNKNMIDFGEYAEIVSDGIKVNYTDIMSNKIKLLQGQFKPNTQYVFKCKAKELTQQNKNPRIRFVYTDGSMANTSAMNSVDFSEIMFRSYEDKTIDHITFTASSWGGELILKDCILMEGSNFPTEYIEPKQHKTEILLDEPLRGLPNGVCDERVGNQLIRRIGVINGVENFRKNGIFDGTTGSRFIMRLESAKQIRNTVVLSNLIPFKVSNSSWREEGFYITTDEFTMNFGLNIRLHEDLSEKEFKSKYKDLKIYYELAEPIIEELPNGITLQGFDDTTMYIENSITPTVSYGYNALIPYKEELSKQKEEVETNTLDIEQNIIPYLMDMEFNLMLMEDN